MKIDHLALWVKDLESMKDFYIKYFRAVANEKYSKEKKGLETYILSFEEDARLELMRIPGIKILPDKKEHNYEGYCHISFALGSEKEVDKHSAFLKSEGFKIRSCFGNNLKSISISKGKNFSKPLPDNIMIIHLYRRKMIRA